ncbi:MAG: efflux RND transporter periplasmic adaptor subunit [Paracoccaceae bacterium]
MADGSAEVAKLVAGRRRRRRLWPWLALVVLIGGAAAGWAMLRPGQQGEGTRYTTEEIRKGDLIVSVTATGTVQPTTTVTVSSELSGTIDTVDVDFNSPVTSGQVLATLDSVKLTAQVTNAEASLAVARGQLAQAEATAREAEANYVQQKAINDKGVGTTRDLVTYQAAHERAQAALAVAQASLQLAEANLASVKADLSKTTIRSSIDGIVLDRAAEVGQIVASSLNAPTLFTLASDLRHMQLLVDVDEADIGKVETGDPATFTVDAFPGRTFPAKIEQVRFNSATTNNVVTYKAQLSVDNQDLLLRPGMTATAVIRVTELHDVLLVPNAALRYAPPRQQEARSRTASGGLAGLIMPRRPPGGGDQQGTATRGKLWVLRDGAPVQVDARTGETDGRFSALVSGDLAEGDRIITGQSTGTGQ